MKRILIGTVAMIMVMPAFADDPWGGGPAVPMGGYSCTVTYNCGDGTGASRSYTNDDANNVVITVSENTTCSKSGTTFSHWAVTSNGPSVTPLSPVAHPGESYDTTGCVDGTGDSFVFTAVYTSDNARTTSQPYVYNRIQEETQIKIPATNPSNTNIGNTVITYTNVEGGGVIGERELFTGGTYDADNDSGKLITASALNNTFTNLPTTGTTKLECANQSGGCTLWTIIDQTAYGAGGGSGGTDPAILAMLQALVNTNGTGKCYKLLIDGYVDAGTCTPAPEKYGDWGTTFTYEGNTVQISGISACSSLSGTYPQEASDQNRVDADYATSGGGNSSNTNPPGKYCYCKMTGPAESRWVFSGSYSSSSDCADDCAYRCGYYGEEVSGFRSGVFGAVQQ